MQLTVYLGCLLTGAVALFAPRNAPLIGELLSIRIWRRMTAFLIDVFVAGLLAVSVFGPVWLTLPLEPAVSDTPVGQAYWWLAVQIAAMLGLFWLHPKYGRATPGQYILGYRIEADPAATGRPLHFLRMFAGFYALCSVYLWIWFLKREDSERGHYWWDRAGRTRAVFVGPK